MLNGHGGNRRAAAGLIGCPATEIVDMSSNMNPLGPLPGLLAHLAADISALTCLPEADGREMVQAFARRHGLDPDTILAGSGTTQFIHALPAALEPPRALIVGPAYADYADACLARKIPCDTLYASPANGFLPPLAELMEKSRGCGLVFICNPNNPTGRLISGHHLRQLCSAHPKNVFVIDESYLAFSAAAKDATLLQNRPPNALILHSFSKIFAIPGLRVGFLAAAPEIITKLRPYIPPWSVNSLAESAAAFLLGQAFEEAEAFAAGTRTWLWAERDFVQARLSPKLTVFPSETSFLLMALPAGHTSGAIWQKMLTHKILIRNCANFSGLNDRFIRLSLKTRSYNLRAVQLLSRILEPA